MVHYLSQHPEIYFSPEKEPHYFNSDSGHRYYFDEVSYLSLFSAADYKSKYIGEGSVWYLYSEVALDEILKFNPSAKIIVMLRDPKSMYFSLHRELLFGGAENESSPQKAWDLQFVRQKGQAIPIGCSDPKLLQYGNVCKLGAQLERVIKKVPKDQLKVIFLEDMIENPDKVYRTTLRFLDMEDKSLDSYAKINKKKARKFPILAKTLLYFSAFKKRLGINKGFGLANKINKANITHKLMDISEDMNNMDSMLSAYFLEDIKLLERLTSRDLDHWKKGVK